MTQNETAYFRCTANWNNNNGILWVTSNGLKWEGFQLKTSFPWSEIGGHEYSPDTHSKVLIRVKDKTNRELARFELATGNRESDLRRKEELKLAINENKDGQVIAKYASSSYTITNMH